jgi:hypothetical protein
MSAQNQTMQKSSAVWRFEKRDDAGGVVNRVFPLNPVLNGGPRYAEFFGDFALTMPFGRGFVL